MDHSNYSAGFVSWHWVRLGKTEPRRTGDMEVPRISLVYFLSIGIEQSYNEGGIMKQIWKYQIPVVDMQGVQMPEGAEILSAQIQEPQQLCLWVLVDPSKRKVERCITIHGTGHIVLQPENKRFIDTVQLMDGQLVFHVFELKGE